VRFIFITFLKIKGFFIVFKCILHGKKYLINVFVYGFNILILKIKKIIYKKKILKVFFCGKKIFLKKIEFFYYKLIF
jgi:hypothetical protein